MADLPWLQALLPSTARTQAPESAIAALMGGDPAASWRAMQPAGSGPYTQTLAEPYLRDVLTGQVAARGLQNVNDTFANARAGDANALGELAGIFGAGPMARVGGAATAAAAMPRGVKGNSGPQAILGPDAAFERMVGPGYIGQARPDLTGGAANRNVEPQSMRDALRLIMGDEGGGGPPLFGYGKGPIRAYHGSPYDFDQFDLSKIGTGEGAQAYGHGLYFAERPEVASTYKLANAPTGVTSVTQQLVKDAQSQAAAKGLEGDRATAFAQKWLDSQGRRSGRQMYYDALNNYDTIVNSPGHMYEVDLHADPARFLDWDKLLPAQSPDVLDRLAQLGGWRGTSYKGSSVYHGLGAFDGAPSATRKLNEAGIPGIRYLDRGSRGAGQGTSNYVVFDPNIIEILRKYGLAGATAGAGGTLASILGSGDAQAQEQPQYPYPPQEYIEPPPARGR